MCELTMSQFATKDDLIESLRQQVADEKSVVFYQKEMSHILREQLAIRELEILKLREALEHANYTLGIVEHYQCCNKTVGGGCTCSLDKCKKKVEKALSTPLTTEHLDEWMKEILSTWWAVIMETAASYEVSSYSIKDEDAKNNAINAIEYARKKANELWNDGKTTPLYSVKEVV